MRIVRRLFTPLVLSVLCVLLVPASISVFADWPRIPYDYTQLAPGGRFVFVMLTPEEERQVPSIRSQYPEAGMYRNDGSATPLWTVDWYSFKVDLTSDGVYLVRWGPWPGWGEFGELALAFYRNGHKLKSYKVRDLVAIPELLPRSASHYQWLKSALFNDAARVVKVETYNGETYAFDVTTGAVILSSPCGRSIGSTPGQGHKRPLHC
ncbi:MAG TPA: hypothetical protein VJ123_05955 [Anaerolineales bacterium]|nr:hypothetical protein [Anaerolineales bacterium]